jgi:hypothetical protein
VKGLEKLTGIRLAEVLSQKNVVSADAITDALYMQETLGEAFVDALVSSGSITEWDLAKVVVEHFQVPFMMATNYELSDEARVRLPKETLFRHLLVPLDLFGDAMTVVMPILAPCDVLEAIQREHKVDLFPYVGLISENKQVLQESFEGFKEWQQAEEERREKKRRTAPKQKGDGDWMNIFDNADAAVRGSLGQP